MRPSSSITSNPRSEPLIRDNQNPIPSSTIRPRNKRLVSTEQELVSTSATSTPGGSRAASPLPSKHPSRTVSNHSTGNQNGRPVGGLLAPPRDGRGGTSSPVNVGGVWQGGWMSSWTALQGIANSVLGAVEGESDSDARPTTSSSRNRKTTLGKAKTPDKWGPSSSAWRKTDGGIGTGSTEELQAALMQRKRAGVLEGRDEDRLPDTSGNYKRRTSTEDLRPGSSQEDDQALVYVHHVQKQDTLQGVILRYNCKPDVFRKANRFWPNDSVQVRKTVVLPVDACTVKGRPCDAPSSEYPYQGVDLLAPTPGIEETPFPNGGDSSWPGTTRSGKSAELSEENENPWVHVRWVLIDSSPNSKPVEIGRMPRKTLGYFPPRRRKSTVTPSIASTPRESSELTRLAQSTSNDQTASTASTPSRQSSSLGPRPSIFIGSIGSYFPHKTTTRVRRESVGEAADRLGWMRGPGGVGTFGKNVRRPGPGNDGLNSWARKHIPGLTMESLPSRSISGGDAAHFGFSDDLASISEGANSGSSSYNNPNGSGSATLSAGQGLGLENAAAAIEGWVRRMATVTPGTPKGGGRIDSQPDLIELLDGTGSDDGRGFELSPGRLRSATPVGGTGRKDLDCVIRGRTTAGAKGGKSD
ncbi:uncharacterized protein RCO7_07554 [Rhynchosporium graminicola]|uniref:LysM domain-containing protein n=1 Tax=Rhynchosporium graminicola TaxID=2792576 RepID=A0A1E1KZZ9_9HELO|nr:uncharacterized protein RCO7_07554 [Rhynchosporium commune]